jgi:hypothetical protein
MGGVSNPKAKQKQVLANDILIGKPLCLANHDSFVHVMPQRERSMSLPRPW